MNNIQFIVFHPGTVINYDLLILNKNEISSIEYDKNYPDFCTIHMKNKKSYEVKVLIDELLKQFRTYGFITP